MCSAPNRALTVLQIRSAFEDSGPGTQSLEIAKELRRRGHRVVFASGGGILVPEIQAEGFPYHCIPELALDRRDPLSTALNIWTVRRLLQQHAVDVIHGHNAAATLCAWLASHLGRRPCIVTQSVRGLELRPNYRWRNWIYRGYPATMFAVSQFTRDWLERIGAPADRIVVTYNGVDLARFNLDAIDRRRIRRELGIPPEAVVVGTVGGLNFDKAQYVLIEAASRLVESTPPFHVILVGDGPARERCEAAARNSGMADRVHLVGFRRDIPDFQAAFDVFAQPSVRGEMFPNAILEAMAMGNPWIGSDISGLGELTEGGRTGFVSTPGDRDALSANLARLLTDEGLRRSMGAAARTTVLEKYAIGRVVDRIEQTYFRKLEDVRRP